MSRAFFRREQERLSSALAKSYDEIRLGLRAEALHYCRHIVDRLAPDEEGRKKVLRDAPVDNLVDFLSHLPVRDVTEDEELRAEAEKARLLVQGMDLERLRKDAAFRQDVGAAFAKITGRIDALVDEQERSIKVA